MASQTVFDQAIHALEPSGGWSAVFGSRLLGSGDPHVTYLFMTGVAVLATLGLAAVARRGYDAPKKEAMVPDEGMTARNFFDVVLGMTFELMADLMGREEAKRYFPVIATLSVFILICNLLGLVPGFTPPTQNLNMPVAMAVSVFIYYNILGLSRHGFDYIKELTGPEFGLHAIISIGMSALLFVIEVIGHLARPLSLAVRLTGNMTADHAVLGAFGDVGAMVFQGLPLLFPIPFFFLGLLISIIQTLVFALLSAIYIALAIEEGH